MRKNIHNPGVGRFVVGVDFGTTFTSVAFAHSIMPEEVKLVQSWPNGSSSGESAEQVPTELFYTRLGEPRQYQWGNEIPPPSKNRKEPLRWFKLLLQNDSRAEPQRPRTVTDVAENALQHLTKLLGALPTDLANEEGRATPAYETSIQLRQARIAPRTVVEDFLAGVRKVAVRSMESTYDEQFVQASKVEYIITIPAIWSDSAKGQMVKACEGAGFGEHRKDFHLVSEPEAAAAHTLKVVQPSNLYPDDTFIICDAGGGTVDLISYKIRSMDPVLVIDEVVSGSGDLCGSVYLDAAFKEYIYRRLGSQAMDRMSSKAKEKMQKSWQEEIKFKFGSKTHSRNSAFEVAVPGLADDEDLDIEEGYHTMERHDIEAIFDPIVDRIIDLIDNQVKGVEATNRKVASILLVGGFGSSEYLLERLQTAVYGNKRNRIRVIQPINAKTAIARGALLRGLDGSCVKEKRSRLFYGVIADTAQSKYPQHAARRYWDDVDRMYRIRGHMNWYVKKEDIFSCEKTHSQDFFRLVPVMSPNFIFHEDVWGCAQNKPPTFEWETGAEIFKVGGFVANLSSAPAKSLTIHAAESGLKYYRVTYTIKMTMVDDVLKFETIFGGVSYGEATLEFESK